MAQFIKITISSGEIWLNKDSIHYFQRSNQNPGGTYISLNPDGSYTVQESVEDIINQINQELVEV